MALIDSKVSKFQNEFMKTYFLPTYEPNIIRISALYCATLMDKNPFGSYFGRNNELINSFWNLLTFKQRHMGPVNPLFRRSCVHIIIFTLCMILCILIIAKRRVLFSDVITDVNLSVIVGFLPFFPPQINQPNNWRIYVRNDVTNFLS